MTSLLDHSTSRKNVHRKRKYASAPINKLVGQYHPHTTFWLIEKIKPTTELMPLPGLTKSEHRGTITKNFIEDCGG